MADNTVQVTFKVNSDGSLQQVAKNADKAAKGMDKATASTVNYNRSARGVANLQGNQTKAFAATARGTSGLVAAYATLMAHVFALTAAFGALQRASALQQLEQGLIAVGNAAGQNLPYVAQEIQNITGSAVTLQEAMEGTALAMSAGFGIDQLKELTKVARGASIALGRNMGDALTRLVKGTAKLEPEILDELGIMVRLDKASQDYAASLGKTVTQLTRFEKQQAFLNATIDQGQKKFSVVLDSIDPDPYSKLSSAFLDLTKDLTTLINKGLIPVINFLSNSKFAMTGAIILFASSITRMLLPALGDMAAANAATAAQQAASATSAARVVSTQYLGAVKKVNAAFKTVPPSVKAVEAQFRAGTLTIAQYKSALTQLMKSEKLRAIRIKANGANASADKKRELAEIRTLIAETQRLIALEGQRTMLGGKGQLAKTSSKLSKRQSIYQNKIGESSVMGGFAVAGKGAKQHFKDVGKASGKLNKLKLGLEATTKSAGLFGSALLRFVPIIGWAFTAFSLLSPLLGDMFKKGAVAKAADEVVDSFDSFARVANQLNKELEKTDSMFERTNKMLSVRVGLLNQVSAGVNKVVSAQQEENNKREEEALRDLVEARNAEVGVFLSAIAKKNNITLAEKRYQSALNKSKSISKEAAQQVLEEAKARIEATGMAKVFGNELTKLGNIQSRLAGMEEGQLIDGESLIKAVSDIEKPAKALKAAQDEANEATIKLENQVKSATEKSKGMFGELFTNVSGLANALNLVKEKAEETGTSNIELVTKEQRAEVTRLAAALDSDMVLSIAADGTETVNYHKTLENIQDIVAKNNKTAAEAVEISRNHANTAKQIGDIAKMNSAAYKLQLSFEVDSLEATKKGLEAKRSNLLAQEGITSQSEEVLKLDQQINNTQQKINSHSEDGIKIAMRLEKVKQRNLGYDTRALDIQEKIAKNAQDQVKRELELKRKKIGAEVTAADEVLILKKAEQENSKNRAARLAAELTKLDIEFDLIKLQFDLEKARIDRLVKEGKISAEDAKTLKAPINAVNAKIEGTGGLRETAKAGAVDASKAAGDKAAHDIAMKQAEAEQERFNKKISGFNDVAKAGMQAERDIENATALRAQREAEIAQAVKDGTMTQAEGDQATYDAKAAALNSYASSVNSTLSSIGDAMAAIGPEGALMSATLSGVGSMTESFTHAFTVIKDESASMADKMQAGLGAIGSAISAIGGMQKASSEARIKALDGEIAAEKKRDGKSAGSQAKISALEKKRELEKRKAFEQDKKMKIAQTVISTMQGAISAYTAMAVIPIVGPALGAAAAAMVLSMGKQQVAAIKATTYQGGSVSGGPTSLSIGEKSNSVDLAAGGSQGGELAYMRGGSGTGNATNFTPAFSGYKNRAAGGSAGYIVGEQGPELFVPETPGEIMSAGDTAKMSSPTNINFTVSAVDATGVEELLVAQRGNIIKMIRQAANQQGEYFLERVSENEL